MKRKMCSMLIFSILFFVGCGSKTTDSEVGNQDVPVIIRDEAVTDEQVVDVEDEEGSSEEDKSVGSVKSSLSTSSSSYSAIVSNHEHNWEEVTRTGGEPVCTSAASVLYECSVCGLQKMEMEEAPGHNYESVEVAATCTTPGYTLYTCSVCGNTYTANETAMSAHTSATRVIQEATCEIDGILEEYCKVCDVTLSYSTISAIGHDWELTDKGLVCQEGAVDTYTCKNCKNTKTAVIETVDHTWGSWKVTTTATCSTEGVQTRTCSVCGETQTQSIDTIDHSWGSWKITTAATCSKEGVQTRTCSKCEETETKAIDKVDHTYAWVVKSEATCTTTGLRAYECTECGYQSKTEVIAKLAHSMGSEPIDTAEATCTVDGYKIYKCNNCTYTETVTLPKLGHSYADGVCTRCGASE